MVLSGVWAALGRRFNRYPAPSDEELATYAADVMPVLDRAERLYQEWFEQAALLQDSEKLANRAAIHRWAAATMSQALEMVAPPPAVAKAHAALVEVLLMASRAAQLLGNGSRFHNANAVCDGQTMLEESRRRRLVAAGKINRYLDRHRPRSAERQPTEQHATTDASELVGTSRSSPE